MPNYTAIVTLLAVLFYFYTSIEVAKARAKFGVKVPAISGQPDFERVFRVQMNTLEWLPIFLPSLWLFAVYINDAVAAAIGLLWIFGRILYFRGYIKAAEKRSNGFLIQTLAAGVLLIGAFASAVGRIVSGT
jgi:glutathione S-transferase